MKPLVLDLCDARGKVPTFFPPGGASVVLQDDADGLGPFIAHWDESELGPLPTTTDGFTRDHLRRVTNGKLVTAAELHSKRPAARNREET